MFRHDHEPLSFITHFIGTLFSIAGLVLLIVAAARYGTAYHVVSFSLFGTALVGLYGASSMYHIIPKGSIWKARLQVVDHSMIFFLIAGTYTPIALIPLRGPWGWSLFGVVWGIALVGVLIKTIRPLRYRVPHALVVVLYAVMGWIAVIAIVPLVQSLSGTSLVLLFAGGLAYTIGIIFFALDNHVPRSKWFGMHEIWHLFVLAGSICHFILIYHYLLPALE
jgi:hemolysin III